MIRSEAEGLAAEYVLGTLAGDEREQFIDALARDPALQALVEDWAARLAPLNDPITPMRPPAGVWRNIEAILDDFTAPGAAAVTIRAGDGGWKRLVHGVDKKLLFVDPSAGTESYLLRFAPGAWLPAHGHHLAEQCLMLEGELTIGDQRFGPGDFHAAPAGVPHPMIVSEGGALAFITGELRERLG